MTDVYFPETCMVSVVTTMRNGSCVEAGSSERGAWRRSGHPEVGGAPARQLRPGARKGGTPVRGYVPPGLGAGHRAHDLSLRYASIFLQQVARSAACNALHRLEQRCARWLLLAADELQRVDYSLTHEYLAEMLACGEPASRTLASEFSERGSSSTREAGCGSWTRGDSRRPPASAITS
jgi:hypothetical protein